MSSKVLFIQTTDIRRNLYGLINLDSKKVELHEIIDPKQSTNLLHLIYEMLKSHKLNLREDISKMLICSGPGSYTGMRVGEGIGSIMELMQFEVLNYYQYELAQSYSPKTGSWICKAFKGEYFVCQWETGTDFSTKLIPESEVENIMSVSEIIFYSGDIGNIKSRSNKLVCLEDQMLKSPEAIYSLMQKSRRLSPYYFRPPEDEFRTMKTC